MMIRWYFLGGLALLFAAFTGPDSRAAERITASYGVRWAGMQVFALDITVDRSGPHYRITTHGQTQGLLRWLVSGVTDVRAEGQVNPDGRPVPSLYRNSGNWTGKTYLREMVFDASGALVASKADIPADWVSKYPREDIPPDQQRGPDPISLIMAFFDADFVQSALVGPQAVRAFDGRQVYDVLLDCGGPGAAKEQLDTAYYSGDAQACTVDYQLISGKLMLSEEERADLRREQETYRKRLERRHRRGRSARSDSDDAPMRVLVAPLEAGGLTLPLKGEMPTGFGRMTLEMTAFSREALPAFESAAYGRSGVTDQCAAKVADAGPGIAC